MQSLYAPFVIVAPSSRVEMDTLTQFGFGDRAVVIDRVDEHPTVPSVTVDNRRGIELAFDHLRSLGHRRIGYVSGISGIHTAHERLDAYSELGAESIVLDSGVDADAGAGAAQLLAVTDPPTAIIAGNDMTAFGVISKLAAQGLRVPTDVSVVGFDGLVLSARYNPVLTTIRQPIAGHGQHRDRPRGEEGTRRIGRSRCPDPRAAGRGLHRRAAGMTARTGGELPRIPGVRYADHVAFTVPDLDQAVRFFVEALGAQELYRSTRGRMPTSCPRTSPCQRTRGLTLAMPDAANLNVELFEWSSSDRRTEHPRHSDAGGHHLCFTVADVDQAVAVLRGIPGVRLLGDRKEVAGDSPRVAGNRWIYFLTPWGLLMEIVDRSRVADPPPWSAPPTGTPQLTTPQHTTTPERTSDHAYRRPTLAPRNRPFRRRSSCSRPPAWTPRR